jgi:HK97 gp10 family phage protein
MPIDVHFDRDGLSRQLRKAAFRGVVAGTEMVRAEMIRLILATEKSGRVYARRGVKHQASAPGEAPASDTGRLVSSIHTSYNEVNLSGKVTIGTAYGLMLEYGTERIEPRPFARPAVANTAQAVAEVIAREIARG